MLQISPAWLAFGVITSLVFGVLVRASFVLAADFPLNDGGMFYTMATELQSNGYRLPEFTSYNFDSIPFAYPPLAFYVAAALDDLTPLSMLDVFRLLPLAASIATMLAFVLLAWRLLPERVAFLASVFAFAMIPFSFEWMIMGGGITRSLGMCFALLGLHEAHRLYTTRSPWCVMTTGVLAGLCVLSHLEMASFFAFSTALFFLAYGRNWRGARDTALAAILATAVAAPWLVTVIANHGIEPMVAALSARSPSPVNPVLTFLVFRPTDEPLFAIIAAIALMGIAWSLSRGHWLLPAWVVACGLLDPRGFGNVASVPIAMLAGIAVAEVLLPLLTPSNLIGPTRWALPSVTFGLLSGYVLIGALVATPRLLTSLEPEERDAMGWVRANTPPDSKFAVVTDEMWARDRSSEWFSVLAGRQSIATVQGSEWTRGKFAGRTQASEDLQLCAEQTTECLNSWASERNEEFDYVYLPKWAEITAGPVDHPDECCAALRQSLLEDSAYKAVYDGPGATVFRRN